jgi:hypothetical protein
MKTYGKGAKVEFAVMGMLPIRYMANMLIRMSVMSPLPLLEYS